MTRRNDGTPVAITSLLGPFTAPPVLIGVLLVLLLVLVVGRVLVGLAWRLVLVALAVVAGLWLLGVLGSVIDLV